MKRLLPLAVVFAICWATCAASVANELDELMPVPVKVERRDGWTHASSLRSAKVVRADVPGAPSATADEAYVLEIDECGATITASGSRGERWARVTLDQLSALSGGMVPRCRITDWPRLKWRGFMLDNARNYLPVQGVKDVIDVMSKYKLNLFHWHLTENYAWRLESKKYPELQSERAFFLRHKGKFYTQEEFREIVDYAYERGICTMPELDMPAHSGAFRSAFGFKTMSEPGVGEKAAELFDELCSLAPAEKMPFVHMGTDEVWKRDVEAASREALEKISAVIAKHGRSVVRWTPGEEFDCADPFVNMLWTNEANPDKNPGPYFDAIGMYIEDFDPFELLSVATYHKAARWHDAGARNLGAVFCAWHDGFVGQKYENLLRNQQVFPSCVLFGNAYWRGRDDDLSKFRKCLPRGGDARLAEAIDVERRMIAQRDRALSGLKHPFHFLRQTDMRWRLTQADGTLIATDVAQATISPRRLGGDDLSPSNGTVVAETWIKSPKEQTVGAWIGFTNISRDHGLAYSAPLPGVGEWNRFGASVELNGEKIAPPKWNRPGLEKGGPADVWCSTGTIYEADEVPFTDQEYYMREPTRIRLREGWNHVRLTIPNPMLHGAKKHRWTATFIPVAGTSDHPTEVPGLEYSSEPPRHGTRLLYWNIQDGMWDGQTDNFNRFVEWVQKQSPDICVFAEVRTKRQTGKTDHVKDESQRILPKGWPKLAARYGHDHVWISSDNPKCYMQGITSRFPIEGVAKDLVPTGSGWARVKVGTNVVNIVTVHLNWAPWGHGCKTDAQRKASAAKFGGDLARRDEIETVLRQSYLRVPGASNQFWVVAGDFNALSPFDARMYDLPSDSPRYAVHRWIAEATPLVDALHEWLPNDFHVTCGAKSRLDYVYLTRGLYDRATEVRVVVDRYTRPTYAGVSDIWRPSDHRPILVDFDF